MIPRVLTIASSDSGGGVTDVYQGSLFSQQRVKSYAQIINSPTILDPVIRQLGLKPLRVRQARTSTGTVPVQIHDSVRLTIRDATARAM